jgi:flagellar hook-associated protein 3 FlgL
MNLRVTQQTVIQRALADSQRLASQLATLQAQSASGKRFSAVSDNPASSLKILSTTAQDETLGAHLDNVASVRTALNGSVSALQDVSAIFTQARSIAIEASHSTNNATSFEALAGEVDRIIDRLTDVANTQQNGVFLFAGSASKVEPFVVTKRNAQGQPLEVRYQAADDPIYAIIDRRRQIAIDYPGSDVFMSRDRQPPVYTGATGAQPGSGTDTATGQTDLVLTHTATTFAPGSGVQAGASSAALDTVLGPLGRHHLHITDTSGTGAAGTVALDGGTALSFTSADTNLRVTNAQGDVVYLNMSAITANFDGDVDLAGAGAMSIDGGVTSTALTFNPNQIAQGPSGTSLFVDTSAVERSGTEIVDHPGTYDAFQSLITLRDELRNVHGRADDDQIEAISNQLGELDRAHSAVLQTMGEQSASLQALESLESHLQDLQLAAKSTISELGDVDVSELVVKLQSYQQMLQLSLAVFARINDQSLVDFLK